MITKRWTVATVGLLMVFAAIATYFAWPRTNTPVSISADELFPVLDLPDGYYLSPQHNAWSWKNGPKTVFISWNVFHSEEDVLGYHPSGIQLFFSPAFDTKDGKSAGEANGVICKQEVVWTKRKPGSEFANSKMDTTFEYIHGSGYLPFKIDVVVWGKSDEQVEKLARCLESMTFVLK